jgi:hypothetical protein
MFALLDVTRRPFNAHLEDAIDLLRLVEAEPAGTGRDSAMTRGGKRGSS